MASAAADEADDQFAVAAGHYGQKRWELAAEQFDVFLRQNPDHPKAEDSLFFMAEALLQSGKTEEAGSGFRRYLRRAPNGRFARPALFRAGEAAYLTGDLELAETQLGRFQAEYPNDKLNAYVLPYLGDAALRKGAVDRAEGLFRAGLERFPEGNLTDDCRFGLARCLEKGGQNEEAVRLYRAVASRPECPLAELAQFHLGALQYALEDYAAAEETFGAFETTFSRSPWRPRARLSQGWALLKLNKVQEAEQAFRTIASDPKLGVEAQYWLGMAQRIEQDWARASETLLAAAAAAGPNHKLCVASRFHAGDALRRSGNLGGAIEQFDLVITSPVAENQWADDAMHGKIRAALEANDQPTVERTTREFRRRFPDSPLENDVCRMLAQSCLKRQQYAEARDLLEPLTNGAVLNEQTIADRYLLCQAYAGLERHNEALAVLLPVLDSARGRLKADAQLMQGSLLVATQRYTEAIGPLEAYLSTGPNGDAEAKARGELAICYARSGQLAKAKQAYAELSAEYPQHPLLAPTTEQLAEAALEASDTQWSTELFDRLRTAGSSDEDRAKGLSGLGWSQLQSGRLQQAAATYGELLAEDPPPPLATEAAMIRGRILEKLSRMDAALAMYDLVLDRFPDSKRRPEALLAAARLRDRLEQDREAAVLYQKLASEYPQLPEMDAVLYDWAWSLDDLGKPAEAGELLERLRREFPDSPLRADATLRLAQRAYAGQQYADAERLTAEVLATGTKPTTRHNALNLQATIAIAQENWQQVRAVYRTLIEEFPDSTRRVFAEYWIAEATYRLREYEEAARLFDRLSTQIQGRGEPWLAFVPLRRAQTLAHLKQWEEAYAVACEIAAQHPDFQRQYEADYVIGRCLSAQADFQEARETYRRVIRSPHGAKTETAAMAQLMIGESYFHQKNYEAALREFLRLEILYAYPYWQAMALLEAGKCHEKLGEPGKAAELYARLLKLYPDTPFAKQARQWLDTDAAERPGADPPTRHGKTIRSIRKGT